MTVLEVKASIDDAGGTASSSGKWRYVGTTDGDGGAGIGGVDGGIGMLAAVVELIA